MMAWIMYAMVAIVLLNWTAIERTMRLYYLDLKMKYLTWKIKRMIGKHYKNYEVEWR